MAQKTAKTVRDVLEWVEENAHHFGTWDDEPGFFVLMGHGCKLRIPEEIQKQTRNLIEPGNQFDTRMFRANYRGLEILRNPNA